MAFNYILLSMNFENVDDKKQKKRHMKLFLCPRDRRSGGILFLSCLSFRHSIILSETLTLLITFEQWVLALWYFKWVFLVIRPSRGYHYFFTLWPWPRRMTHFFDKFNLAYNFWTVSARALIFHMSIPCDKSFPWVPLFFTLWPWPLSLTHFKKNLNLAYNFWTVSARALIFHMSITWDKRLIFGTKPFDLDIWHIFKKNDIGHNFWIINIRPFILHKTISCDKIFLLVSRWHICPCDLDHLWNWPFWGHLCFTNTSCTYIDYTYQNGWFLKNSA